jgi:hypothetical protein
MASASMQMQPEPKRARPDEAAKARQKEQESKLAQQAQRRAKLESYKAELTAHLDHILGHMGYIPPDPSPFLKTRALKAITREIAADRADPDVTEAISILEREIESEYALAYGFLEETRRSLRESTPIVTHVKALFQRFDPIIERASITIDMPDASPELEARMLRIERFLAQNWVEEAGRGILAVHIDEASQTTILQVGIAKHGPVYISVPRILRPEDIALNSIAELLKRIEPLRNEADPMAIIDGSYNALNFNEIFSKSRVIRAPSGDTSRLAANIRETARRDRLVPDNTVILNSSPSTLEEYVRVFPSDRRGRHWAAWGNETELWNGAVSREQFSSAPEASRAAFLAALTQTENVVVIVAHCDGKSLFMPAPPPDGTVVTAEYLLENREKIAANSPFVYLFSCEAGDLDNLGNFASTLLDCGASGVIASQTILGAAEGRTLLARLLGKERRAPPIEDFWQAMRQVDFLEMEVFLA